MKISSLFKPREPNDFPSFLSKFVNPEALEKITKGKDPTLESFQKAGLITFMITQVNDAPLSKLKELQKDVVLSILETKGVIDCIISSIMVATFGFPFEDSKNARELCESTARTLLKLLKHDIKIIHGQEESFFANLGSPRIFRYGPIISDLSGKFSLLNKLEFGQILKV